jgi:hypothetical protein
MHGKTRNPYRVLVGSEKERDHYRDLDVGGRIIFYCIIRKLVGSGMCSINQVLCGDL